MTARSIWLTPRALRLHAVLLVVVPACMALCIWQLERALGGNTLSWAYVFEWPLFAGYAVYMWWRFVHEPPEGAPANAGGTADGDAVPNGDPAAAARRAAEAERRANDDAELSAYNEYLAQLAEQDQAAAHDPAPPRAPKHTP
jgi:hypothetical protein